MKYIDFLISAQNRYWKELLQINEYREQMEQKEKKAFDVIAQFIQ